MAGRSDGLLGLHRVWFPGHVDCPACGGSVRYAKREYHIIETADDGFEHHSTRPRQLEKELASLEYQLNSVRTSERGIRKVVGNEGERPRPDIERRFIAFAETKR